MTALETLETIVQIGREGEHVQLGGYDMVFKSPAGSDGGWTVIDYTLAPRQPGPPLHYHRHLTESFFVISGELRMQVGDREIDAGPGSYVLVPPGVAHTFANRTDQPVRILAQASSPEHKKFLLEIVEMAKAEGTWPPRDMRKLVELGESYDSYYL